VGSVAETPRRPDASRDTDSASGSAQPRGVLGAAALISAAPRGSGCPMITSWLPH